jgi:hypothetical protein
MHKGKHIKYCFARILQNVGSQAKAFQSRMIFRNYSGDTKVCCLIQFIVLI